MRPIIDVSGNFVDQMVHFYRGLNFIDLETIYRWQDFFGAIIGAATPILFWFFVSWREKKKKHKEDLYFFERLLVYYINSAIDARTTIIKFLEGNLSKLIAELDQFKRMRKVNVGSIFFPQFLLHEIDKEILHKSTGSGYLDNLLVQIHRMGHSVDESINDLRHQFVETVQLNRTMALKKLLPPEDITETYKENLMEWKQITRAELVDNNIDKYLVSLMNTLTVLRSVMKTGIVWRQFKFGPSFRFFLSQGKMDKFKVGANARIKAYHESAVIAAISEIEDVILRDRLLLVNKKMNEEAEL